MFRKDADFEAFERVMVESHASGTQSASCRIVFCPITGTLLSGRRRTAN